MRTCITCLNRHICCMKTFIRMNISFTSSDVKIHFVVSGNAKNTITNFHTLMIFKHIFKVKLGGTFYIYLYLPSLRNYFSGYFGNQVKFIYLYLWFIHLWLNENCINILKTYEKTFENISNWMEIFSNSGSWCFRSIPSALIFSVFYQTC